MRSSLFFALLLTLTLPVRAQLLSKDCQYSFLPNPTFDSVLGDNCYAVYDQVRSPVSESEKLERDKKVCQCLLEQSYLFHPLDDDGNPLKLSQKEREELENDPMLINDGTLEPIDKYNARIHGKLKQATIALNYQAKFLGSDPASYGLQRFLSSSLAQPIKDQVRKKLTVALSTKGPLDPATVDQIAVISELKVNDQDIDLNVLPEGACITPNEFYEFNQFPTEDEFYQSLSKMKEYKDSDWDFDTLSKDYELLNGKTRKNSSDITLLREMKARLRFLNKNPMIKNLFSASDNYDSVLKAAGYPQETVDLLHKKFEGIDVRGKKKELFSIMAKLRPASPHCAKVGTSSHCLSEVMSGNDIKLYKASLSEFFNDKSVAVLDMAQNIKDFYGDLNGILDPADIPTSQPLNYGHLQNAFAARFGKLPTSCRSSSANGNMSCGETFQQYCPMVRGVVRAQKKSYGGLTDELYFDDLNYWNPDLAENPKYQELNDKICHEKRKVDNKPGSQAVSFNAFKITYCQQAANRLLAACGSGNDSLRILRQKFLDAYPYPDQSENPAEDNLLAGAFNSYDKIGKVKVKTRRVSFSDDSVMNLFAPGAPADLKDATAGTGALAANTPTTESNQGERSSGGKSQESPPVEPLLTQPILSSSMIPETIAKKDPKELTAQDKATVDSAAMAELAELKRQIAENQSSNSNEALMAKMSSMQDLLAEKDKTAAEYQKLIEQLSKKQTEAPRKVATSDKGEEETSPKAAKERDPVSFVNNGDYVDNSQSLRAPASVNSNQLFQDPRTGGASQAGVASLSTPSGNGASATGVGHSSTSSYNSALLEAQESKAGKVHRSSDGSIIMASDANTSVLKALDSAARSTQDYSLSVTPQDYEGFESQNMETLKRYQEKFLTNMESNQPVRVLVKSPNKDPLEFYVVKDGDKLFFKPVRKTGATLEALQQAVRKNP